MFFLIIIFDILLNRRINVFVFTFVEKRVEINIDINVFVISFYNNEILTNATMFFNIILTLYIKTRTLRRNRE